MVMNDIYVNELFAFSKSTIDEIATKYQYNDNIVHLLYIVLPAFIVKYGFDKKNVIVNTFRDVPLILNKKNEKVLQAFYTSIPYKNDMNISTKKCIVINFYRDKDYMELIDNVVHEYNHAINSYNNEIKEDDKYIYLRTGLMYSKYCKDSKLNNEKDSSYILEEIINTKQTEEIIDIINSFNNYDIDDFKTKTALYNINRYIDKNYSSNTYFLQSSICKELMSNETLLSVLSTNRFNGNIDEMAYFFDNILGEDGKYNELIDILNKSVLLEEEYSKVMFFKRRKIIKIKKLYEKAKKIIDTFNRNYHFK